MKKSLIICLSIFLTFSTFAQSNLWSKISLDQTNTKSKMDRASMPSEYQLFSLKFAALQTQLQAAPIDLSNIQSNLVIQFPNADGTFENYRIYEAAIMEKGLADQFPNIKSYIGKGIDDLTATIRFSTTIFGLHTMKFSGNNEAEYIDTFTKDLSNYIVYRKSSVSPTTNFICGVNKTNDLALDNTSVLTDNLAKSSDGKFRIFRLAMASTIEYSAFHVNAAGLSGGTLMQKKAAVLAAMGVTMTRVNGVYEKDLALRMVLIANNNAIIFIDTDNFTNDNADLLINESQAQITSIIGSANFDIGHTVSTGGGGVAAQSPCDDASKASGITGSGAPVGDAYDIDYVAHEMGHQFGANHTFRNSCGGNVNSPTAVEPGSGSTIMAYAGICAPDVQNNSDAYMHTVSIDEIVDLISTTANCAAITINNNAAPVANAGLDYSIPKGTAYVLKGSATDAGSSALTYCWEGIDFGSETQPPIQPPTQTATDGPNFRSLNPTTSPNRYMPELSTVVGGAVTSTWEATSNVGRIQKFTLTVRDNAPLLGGQTGKDTMQVTVIGGAGPFTVTSQNTTGINYLGNSTQTITWNVAGTNVNGIGTSQVNILLSTDNGLTFPTTILANTANDGTEAIIVPNTATYPNCRIMVQAVQNIYYAVNSTRFAITQNLANDNFSFDNFKLFPNPSNGSFKISFNADASSDVKVAINDIRGRKIFAKNYANNGFFNENFQLETIQAGVYLVTIKNGNNKTVKRIVIE